MSRSNKARHGTTCKHWKDTVYASKCQVKAYAKKKRRRSRSERRRQKNEDRVSSETTSMENSG